MVKKMNKKELINALSEKLNLPIEESEQAVNILENYFFFKEKNKDKIVDDLIKKLNITNEKAEKIYYACLEIINTEIKYKLKHPFKSKK